MQAPSSSPPTPTGAVPSRQDRRAGGVRVNAAVLDANRAEILLTPSGAAIALGLTPEDLAASREAGTAPTFIELGARTVRYFRAAVVEAMCTR